MFGPFPHNTVGQLAIAIPQEEERQWKALRAVPDDVAVCAVSLDEYGDLILSYLTDTPDEKSPIFFCFACLSAENAARFEPFRSHELFNTYFGDVQVVVLDGAREAQAQALAGALARFMQPLVHFGVENLHALSTLRREYERVHLRFSALESYIAHSGQQLVRERLLISPDRQRNGEYVYIELVEGRVRQLLPVSSKGLCCIDIFLRFLGTSKTSSLSVTLFLGDSATPEARWTISGPEKASKVGKWHSLALGRALDGISRSVTLEFETNGSSGDMVMLGAGGLIANPSYCPQDVNEHGPVSNRPVAMRLWEGPPGVLSPHAGNVTLQEPNLPSALGTGRLPGTSLQHARPVLDSRWDPGFDAVRFFPDDEAIGVHPPDIGVTGAVIDKVVPRGALSVSATAYIAHDTSKPIEFAIALVDPRQKSPASWSVAPQFAGVVGWSGWRTVGPQQRHQLTVLMGPDFQSVSEKLSLVFITRMENDEANAFAWARFCDVTIEEAQ